ncbi:hypothetical protein CPter91_4579 [Collimonas pratensis]|uniref:Uncharacterized protein n=1 Tax=Collimonas pratensis TaxID=279113 RepID=A0A127QAJ3_9BURK|nr:hypothetical protein CPter91_4579 [Collimonas pratensis]
MLIVYTWSHSRPDLDRLHVPGAADGTIPKNIFSKKLG